jgi:putative autotransporter adhesin-like protein
MRTLILVCLLSSSAFAVDTAHETRAVAAFHAIGIEAVADVDVTIGPVTKVEVSGPTDMLDKLETKVEHGSLQIRTPAIKGKSPTFKVTITTPALTAIAVSGLSNLHVGKLHQSELALDVDGAATFAATGSTDSLAVAVSGAAQLQLKDFATHQIALEVSGVASGAIRADQSLAVSFSGTGSLDVYGKPAITKSVSGMVTLNER